MSTLRITNIEAKADPSSPTVDEKIKLTNSNGDILVHIDGKTSGITTIGINTTAGNIKFDQNSNVVVTGIITATKFVGTIEPTTLTVGGDLTIPDKIVHTGDTNTAIRFPAADTITAETGGSERLRITSGGIVRIPDNGKLTCGDGDDLQIYHNGSHSYIADEGSGELNISGSRIQLMNAARSEKAIDFVQDGAVDIYYDGSRKFRTTSNGVEISGDQVLDGHLDMRDSDRIRLGAGDDLQIFHNGSHSFIENNTGELLIRAKSGENSINCNPDGSIELFHDNSKKFETLSNGTQTTGRVYLNGTNGGLDYNNTAHTLEYLVNGSTHSELNTGAYVPAGTKNLGSNPARWQTLYLSNGIDFGSNSNAAGMTSEVLDDYEEGAFEPRLRFGTSTEIGTFNTQSKAEYVKVGKIVHVSGWARYDSVNTSNSGILHMDLPFTVDEYGMPHNYVYPGSVVLTHTDLQQKGIHIWCGNAGAARTRFGFYNSTSGSTDYVENGDLGGWNGNTRNLHFNFSYQTND